MVKPIEHYVIYHDVRFHAAFPSMARFSDGRLTLAFRRARDGMWLLPAEKREKIDPLSYMDHIDSRSHIVLLALDENGIVAAQNPDQLPADPEAADQETALLALPGDRLLLASFSWYPLPAHASGQPGERSAPGDERVGCHFIYWGSHCSLRERAEGAWVYHHRYLTPDGGYGRWLGSDKSKACVPPAHGQALWRDEEILLPLYGGVDEGCALFVSDDEGSNWHFRSLIALDQQQQVTFQEPALCSDGQGGMVCFMRTSDADGRLATVHSHDGLHWSEPKLHQLIGHPFHPLLLDDGRILLSYGYREKPYGIRARLLDSPLHDPDHSEEIIIRDDGLCPDLGYPWAVQLQNGQMLLSYYWTDTQGTRHIVASRLELSA